MLVRSSQFPPFGLYLVDDKLFHRDQTLARFLTHSAEVTVNVFYYLLAVLIVTRQDLSQHVAGEGKGSRRRGRKEREDHISIIDLPVQKQVELEITMTSLLTWKHPD